MYSHYPDITARLACGYTLGMGISEWAFACSYEFANSFVEWRIARYRRACVGSLTGDVLEIGGGTGANLPFYPTGVNLTFLEPNPHMVRRLRTKAERMGVTISVSEELGEHMPFPDASFDAVVSTLVLCSVTDVAAVVSEARRVLRPGGRFVFYEHVIARGRLGRILQGALNPIWRRVTCGCHLNRDIVGIIRAAGFAQVTSEAFDIRFGTPLALPNVVGEALL